jgi:copper(I)-binding protein
MNLSRPLKVGEQVTTLLTFETAGNLALAAKVRE